MKLKQILFNQFNQIHVKKEEREAFKQLDAYVETFFPNVPAIAKRLWEVRNSNTEHVLVQHFGAFDSCNLYNLPFHTRDNKWLARFLRHYTENNVWFTEYMQANHQIDTKVPNKMIPLATVERYVATSKKFDAKRNQYEQDVVHAYIKNWVDLDANDFFYTKERKDEFKQDLNYDQVFRDKVCLAMSFLGLNQDSVEKSLELNANLWRKNVMETAFENHIQVAYVKDFKDPVKLAERDENGKNKLDQYKDCWLSLRERNYYLKHQAVIDKLKLATPTMKMPLSKAKDLYRQQIDILYNVEYDVKTGKARTNDSGYTK